MRFIIGKRIPTYINRTLKTYFSALVLDPTNFGQKKKSHSRELEVFKPRLVTDNPKTPVLTTRPSQTSPPRFYVR